MRRSGSSTAGDSVNSSATAWLVLALLLRGRELGATGGSDRITLTPDPTRPDPTRSDPATQGLTRSANCPGHCINS